jgi:hypothetical protein
VLRGRDLTWVYLVLRRRLAYLFKNKLNTKSKPPMKYPAELYMPVNMNPTPLIISRKEALLKWRAPSLNESERCSGLTWTPSMSARLFLADRSHIMRHHTATHQITEVTSHSFGNEIKKTASIAAAA